MGQIRYVDAAGATKDVSASAPLPVYVTTPSSTADGAPNSSAVTSVAGAATSTTLLAANTARIGATVFNDSAAILYLLFGTGTASTTNYTVQLATNEYYEVPFGFTGQLTGIWSSATGAARVTEIT